MHLATIGPKTGDAWGSPANKKTKTLIMKNNQLILTCHYKSLLKICETAHQILKKIECRYTANIYSHIVV